MKVPPRSLWWLVAVWAIVLCVPSLRALWRVQIFSTQFATIYNIRSLFWQNAAQKFPGDIAILAQAAEEATPVPQPEDSSEIAPPPPPSMPPASFTVKLMPSPLFPGKPRDSYDFEKMRRYDQLIEKYPDDVWLIARRLRFALSYYHSNRVGGELSDAAIEEHQQAGKPSPERTKDKPNFTVAELQHAIALAKRGQKLEPNDSFFDWALCNFFLMSWRDEEAWQTLDSGARKSGWNEHLIEDAQNKIAAYELALGRALLWEEKLELHTGIYIPQYAHYREAARIISWEGIKAKRRGDHAQALRLWGGLARAGRLMREDGSSYIGGLVGIAVEAIAFGNANYNPRRYLPGSTLPRRVSPPQRLAAFQAYARKHGRADLAREAAREARRKTAYINRVRASTTSQGLYGVPFWQATAIGILWQLGILFWFLLPGALLMCFVLDALFRNRYARALLQMDVQQEKLSRREVIGGALACGGLRALGSTLLVAIGIGLGNVLFMLSQGMKFAEVLKAIVGRWNALLPIGIGDYSFSEGLAYATLNWFSNESITRLHWMIAVLPIVLGLLYALWRAGERQRRLNGEAPICFLSWFVTIVRDGVFDADLDFARAALKLFDCALYIGFVGAWYVFATTSASDSTTITIALSIALGFGGVLFFERFQVWRHRPRRREAARYAVKLWRASLWGWLVLGSTLYLLTLLGAWPLRAGADAKMDKLIRYGEVNAAKMK
jgi:hypothetical protein